MPTHAIQLVPIARIQHATHVPHVVVVATEIFMFSYRYLFMRVRILLASSDTPGHIHTGRVERLHSKLLFIPVNFISKFFYWSLEWLI